MSAGSRLGDLGDLEVSEDLAWQRLEWLLQRVGWVFLAIFLLAAALGVFGGDGPLRETEAGAGPLVIYDRFTRFGSPTEMTVSPPSDAAAGGELKIRVDRDYLAAFELSSITPQPDSVRAGNDELDLHVPCDKSARAGGLQHEAA